MIKVLRGDPSVRYRETRTTEGRCAETEVAGFVVVEEQKCQQQAATVRLKKVRGSKKREHKRFKW